MSILKWLFGSSGAAEEKPAEEEKPKLKSLYRAPVEPGKKDYAIFRGPLGVVAGIKRPYAQSLPVPGPNGRPMMMNGQQVMLKTSGSAFNTTTLSGFIESMEKLGYDMAHEKEILEELKTVTANAGLTEAMAKVRLTGHLIGEPEGGTVILNQPVPTNMKGYTVRAIYPALDRPGYSNVLEFKVP